MDQLQNRTLTTKTFVDESKRAPGLFIVLEENILIEFVNKTFRNMFVRLNLFFKKLNYQKPEF
jgi:hypothetical protein